MCSVGARGTIGMFDAHENQGGQDQNWFYFGNHNGGYILVGQKLEPTLVLFKLVNI